MKLLNLFRKVKEIVDPMIGSTAIHFITHGCQATEHEFDYIGTIVESVFKDLYGSSEPTKFYKVKILKDRNGESRDNMNDKTFAEIPSWYLQKIGGNFYVAYD